MEPRTWILTGSPENFAATREHGFRLIGMKEGRRNMAQQMEPGDRIVFYITRVKAFAGAMRLTGPMFEDRTPVWPGKPGAADPYPWRFEGEPELVLDEDEWVPAEEVVDRLEHAAKWPAEHWTLAFQGQLRTVSEHDARVLQEAMAARAGARAGA
jgi:EVE domain